MWFTSPPEPVVVNVTFDSSFYVGAFNSGGSRLLAMARAGEIAVAVSDAYFQ